MHWAPFAAVVASILTKLLVPLSSAQHPAVDPTGPSALSCVLRNFALCYGDCLRISHTGSALFMELGRLHNFRNGRRLCGSCDIVSTLLVFRSSLAFCFPLKLSRKAPPETSRPYWGSKYSRPVPLCCR